MDWTENRKQGRQISVWVHPQFLPDPPGGFAPQLMGIDGPFQVPEGDLRDWIRAHPQQNELPAYLREE